MVVVVYTSDVVQTMILNRFGDTSGAGVSGGAAKVTLTLGLHSWGWKLLVLYWATAGIFFSWSCSEYLGTGWLIRTVSDQCHRVMPDARESMSPYHVRSAEQSCRICGVLTE